MSKHTPGPWETHENVHPHDQVFAQGEIVADCKWTNHIPQVREANARLIAAAPELLEALRGALASDVELTHDTYGVPRPWVVKARAAIAKATCAR